MLVAALPVLMLATYSLGQPNQAYGPGGQFSIPDNNPNGNSSTINISNPVYSEVDSVDSVIISMGTPHPFVGDLRAKLRSPDGTEIHLFSRVGATPSNPNGDGSNLSGTYHFFPTGTSFAQTAANTADSQSIPSGNYARSTNSQLPGFSDPDDFADFDGEDINGTWRLTISDHVSLDSGSVAFWILSISSKEPVGACCRNGNTCLSNRTLAQCNAANGTWLQGEGCSDCPATCGDNDCDGNETCQNCPGDCGPCTGACCFASGNCTPNQTSTQCANAGGVWQNAGSNCSPNPCPQPPATRLLSVSSLSPSSGVSINVSPNDNNNQGVGVTPFQRIYNQNSQVLLTAPATVNGNVFQKWQIAGQEDVCRSRTITLSTDQTATAVFGPSPGPIHLRVPWDKLGDAGVSETQYWVPETRACHEDQGAIFAGDFYLAADSGDCQRAHESIAFGKSIRAAHGGTFQKSLLSCNGNYWLVVIDNGTDLFGQPVRSNYIHLTPLPSLSNGAIVAAGDIIGTNDDLGCAASGSHLHFYVHRIPTGVPVGPEHRVPLTQVFLDGHAIFSPAAICAGSPADCPSPAGSGQCVYTKMPRGGGGGELPPIISDIPNGTVQEPNSYTGPTPVLLQGTLPITWSLVVSPPGMSIDPISGVVFWAETSANGSPFTITARATNSQGIDDASWQLTVSPCEPTLDGDMNQDSYSNGGDIQLFVRALANSSTQAGDLCRGDFNHSGVIDAADVQGFVESLLAL